MNSFITSAESLVTTHEQIRSGFLEIALEKNRVGDPYVRQAFAFRSMVAHTHSPDELLNISNVRPFMLTAAGLSEKSLQHLDEYIKSDEGFADEAPYNVGPREFLNYIRNAEYIFTDSFHCSVFSILYKKRFFTFSRFNENVRQSTNTRIDNLLNITGLSQRKIDCKYDLKLILNMPCNYTGAEDRLNLLRQSSRAYLHTALAGLNERQ